MIKDNLRERLNRVLTPTLPLGPSDAAQMPDVEVAASLFDPHNKSFNTLLRRDVSVVIGRRGSGKTALLNSYKYRPFLDSQEKFKVSARSDYRSYNVVMEIVTYRQFDDMQRLVVRDPDRFRPIEAIVEDWDSLVNDYFFAQLVHSETERGRQTKSLDKLQRYLHQEQDEYKEQVRRIIWGEQLLFRLRSLFRRQPDNGHEPISRDEALRTAAEHLEAVSTRALILFDSMDEYDIRNPAFTRTLGALIRFTSQLNALQDRIKVKLGLPSEIFPEVERTSANPLKDLINVDQVQWTAMELAQIAAHRFRLFLTIYDPECAEAMDRLDLSRREDITTFWSRFFPPQQPNRYGVKESPTTYILRHTQLLPRQFLMIVQKIIVGSSNHTGGFREFKSDVITQAVEMTEPLIAHEIFQAFAKIFPKAEDLCKPVFANFPTVFSYDELEDRWRKKGRRIAQRRGDDIDMPEFADMLIRMGIVGVGRTETDRYFEATFSYDSLSPMNIGSGHDLCLHPIFSKYFNAAGNAQMKAVIPHGVVRDGI